MSRLALDTPVELTGLDAPYFEPMPRYKDSPRRLAREYLRDASCLYEEASFPAVIRQVAEHDALRIGTLVTEALAQLDEEQVAALNILPVLNTVVATGSQLERLFHQHYSSASSGQLSRFGSTAVRSIEKINAAEPKRFARINAVAVLERGLSLRRPEGAWFVGAMIADGADDLTDERRDYMKSVIPAEESKLTDQFNSGHYKQSVCLLETGNKIVAKRAAKALRQTGLPGIWVTLEEARTVPHSFDPDEFARHYSPSE